MINIFLRSSRRGTLFNSFYVLNEHPSFIREITAEKIPAVLCCVVLFLTAGKQSQLVYKIS